MFVIGNVLMLCRIVCGEILNCWVNFWFVICLWVCRSSRIDNSFEDFMVLIFVESMI